MAGKKKQAPAAPIAVGSLERFVMRKIHRRQMTNAEYNPRVITEEERDRLSKIIEAHGIVAPTTWNKRTGRIVGGHQRTSICDDLYGTDDYEVTVAEIDVDNDREIELNLALNNGQAQGSYDLTKLEQIFRDAPALRIESTGFSGADLFQMFGASPFETRADDALSEVAQKIRDARERQAATKKMVKDREDTDFYVVVVFRDVVARDEFGTSVGWDDNRYQDGRQLAVMCGPWIAERAARASGAAASAGPGPGPGPGGAPAVASAGPGDDGAAGAGAASDAPGEA